MDIKLVAIGFKYLGPRAARLPVRALREGTVVLAVRESGDKVGKRHLVELDPGCQSVLKNRGAVVSDWMSVDDPAAQEVLRQLDGARVDIDLRVPVPTGLGTLDLSLVVQRHKLQPCTVLDHADPQGFALAGSHLVVSGRACVSQIGAAAEHFEHSWGLGA
jgi:hypothetical protein